MKDKLMLDSFALLQDCKQENDFLKQSAIELEKERDAYRDKFNRAGRQLFRVSNERDRYENLLFTLGAMNNPPCFCCGYNGEGYYKPDKHPCAAKHHAVLQEKSDG